LPSPSFAESNGFVGDYCAEEVAAIFDLEGHACHFESDAHDSHGFGIKVEAMQNGVIGIVERLDKFRRPRSSLSP
jgi:hypothetical protein